MGYITGHYNAPNCQSGGSDVMWNGSSNCPPSYAVGFDCVNDYMGAISHYFSDGCPVANCNPELGHIWGADWSPTRGLSYYIDGVKIFTIDGTWTPQNCLVCQSLILIGRTGINTPMRVLWWNYYTGSPQ